ncbi:MAG: tyrosine-type recombinase/integrase [Aliidongia sp.]
MRELPCELDLLGLVELVGKGNTKLSAGLCDGVAGAIFPADVGDGHYTAAKGCLARLCATAEIEGVTPHTLRHTFGSVAGDLGFSELTIAALLGHAARGVTQGYVHIDEALKLAATRTCEEIASLLSDEVALERERHEAHSIVRTGRETLRRKKESTTCQATRSASIVGEGHP